MKNYEHFDHGADIGIRGYGKTIDESFSNLAKALFDVMVDIKKVNKKHKIKFVIEGEDNIDLMINFLNELIYLKDLKNMVFCDFIVMIRMKKLECIAFGEKFDEKKHEFKTDVKAATYSQAKIYKENGLYVSQCVVDV